jgi:hypothetical protein
MLGSRPAAQILWVRIAARAVFFSEKKLLCTTVPMWSSDRAGLDGILARRRAKFARGVRPRVGRIEIEPHIRNGT